MLDFFWVCIFHALYMHSIYIWVNYSDLTVTSLESWLVRGIIPKWPTKIRLVNYCNLPRDIYIYMYIYIHSIYPNSSMISPYSFQKTQPRFLAMQRGEAAKCLSLGFLVSSEAWPGRRIHSWGWKSWENVKKTLKKTVILPCFFSHIINI